MNNLKEKFLAILKKIGKKFNDFVNLIGSTSGGSDNSDEQGLYIEDVSELFYKNEEKPPASNTPFVPRVKTPPLGTSEQDTSRESEPEQEQAQAQAQEL